MVIIVFIIVEDIEIYSTFITDINFLLFFCEYSKASVCLELL